jgi:hypothetical protein
MHSLLLARRGAALGAAAAAKAAAPRRAGHWTLLAAAPAQAQAQAQARALSSAVPKMDDFVKSALGEAGLQQVCCKGILLGTGRCFPVVGDSLTYSCFPLQFASETVKQLNDAQVINTNLLFRLTDADLKAVGLSVGAARALKDAISEAKRHDVVAKSGERAELRRALSAKEKRGF